MRERDDLGGRRRGGGLGAGRGRGRRRGGGLAPQADGNCICPSCGERAGHQVGIPCYVRKCPECGTPMTREQPPTGP